jgi:hypothetical protein
VRLWASGSAQQCMVGDSVALQWHSVALTGTPVGAAVVGEVVGAWLASTAVGGTVGALVGEAVIGEAVGVWVGATVVAMGVSHGRLSGHSSGCGSGGGGPYK